eukprot:6151953-Amphidinium_carterae.1
MLSVSRINKGHVAKLPQILIPSDSTHPDMETCYVFKDPSASQLRQLRVVGTAELTLTEPIVQNNTFFSEQADMALCETLDKDAATANLGMLLSHEKSLDTLEEWLQKCKKTNPEGTGDEEEDDGEESVDGELVGVEAESAAPLQRKASFSAGSHPCTPISKAQRSSPGAASQA